MITYNIAIQILDEYRLLYSSMLPHRLVKSIQLLWPYSDDIYVDEWTYNTDKDILKVYYYDRV